MSLVICFCMSPIAAFLLTILAMFNCADKSFEYCSKKINQLRSWIKSDTRISDW
jgi:hypothetical protein